MVSIAKMESRVFRHGRMSKKIQKASGVREGKTNSFAF